MKLVYLNRKRPFPGSIEILFNTVREFIPDSIDINVFVPKYESQGLFKRIAIVLESYFNQGDVNHITGDIHFATFLLSKNKTILTIHDAVSVIHSKGLKRAILKYLWYTIPLKKVKYVTVISEKTKLELLSLVSFPENRVFVIPDCISNQFQYVEKKEFDKLKPRILQIGTKENKNLIRVCQALKNVPCILDIVGKLSDLQMESLKKNNIEYENSFNISEDTLIQKYINADIVAFVSTYEGFGMPILEAQTVGRPVLTSSISPMTEVARNSACFIDPLNVESIKKGFLKIIEKKDFREKIIAEGLINSKKYKPEIIAKKYMDLYYKVHNESKIS